MRRGGGGGYGWGGIKSRQSKGAITTQSTSIVVHNSSSKGAHIFLVQIPQEDAVVLASTHHPLAFGVCSDKRRKKAEVLIDMPCMGCIVVSASWKGLCTHTCTGFRN